MIRVSRLAAGIGVLIAVAVGLCLVIYWRAPSKTPPQLRLDPTRPVVEVLVPLVDPEKDKGKAHVLAEKIAIPPRGIVRIKGTFRAGSRNGNARIIAEAKVPSASGRMALLSNGVTGLRMKQNAECKFELIMHFPEKFRGGILEIRLKDEFIATAHFGPAR